MLNANRIWCASGRGPVAVVDIGETPDAVAAFEADVARHRVDRSEGDRGRRRVLARWSPAAQTTVCARLPDPASAGRPLPVALGIDRAIAAFRRSRRLPVAADPAAVEAEARMIALLLGIRRLGHQARSGASAVRGA